MKQTTTSTAQILSQEASHTARPPRALFTIAKFAERHSTFLTLFSLTNQVQKAKPRHSSRGMIPGNGLDVAIVRIGGRVLIDEPAYFAWVDAQQGRE